MRRMVCDPYGPRGRRRVLSAASLAALLACMAMPAVASFPQLSLILPRGAQRGGEREFTFQGQRLGDAEEILFHGEGGITVKAIQPVDANSFKAVLSIPETCPLGEQIVQIRCRSGISEYRSFWVGALPVVDEVEPNSLFEQPQAIALDTTVHAIVTGEDVDLYVVEAKKGQRISAEIEGLRLGSYRFDPHVSIVDMRRFELASADDSPATLQDGIISILAPEDGKYVVQVRESSYGGDGNCRYRLHVGTFPRPSAVYPAGGKAGDTMKVTFLGDAAGPLEREIVVPPLGTGPNAEITRVFALDGAASSPSSLPFRISSGGNVLEQEPNGDVASATSGDVATAFNGVIGEPGDVDHFRFGAKKGQVFDVECFARRLRTGLDPVVNILRSNGSNVAGNDDARGPDSAFRFTAPEDGEYVLRVTDHLGRGRPDFVYRVELAPPRPGFSLSIPRIDRYSQTRQTIFVPKGNRFAVLVNASKRNFDGELLFDGSGLPPGITMHAPRMKQGQNQVPIVFEASADAALSGKLVAFEARQVTEQDPEGKTGVRGRFENAADFVLGDPNNSVHYSGRVEKLAVAVVEAVPFSIEIVQPKAPVVRNGRIDLKIRVTRGEGFKQPVTVEFPFRPPGIGALPNITIAPDATEGIYQLSCAGNAAVGQWLVYAIGAADVGGTAWVASPMATLEVAEPFTTATLARASCEKGSPAQVVCTLAHPRPFEGEALARLQGLPPETSAPEMPFTKDTPQLVFNVTTGEKSPVGNHKGIFVEITTPIGGEPVKMSGGGTELQIAAPAPAKPAPVAAAAAPATPKPPAPPSAKPLSRLEKLRQQSQPTPAG
jgi:hypothetical protein